jgi:hypothetical protein
MLPRPTRPEYSTTVPSTGKKVKYNPFSVREEKILVLASEGNDPDEITNAIVNVLQNCITSPSDLKVEQLALFDIEFLFLKARAKSVGESINLKVTDPDDETYTVSHSINIDRIGIDRTKDHSNVIFIDDDMQVKMKYPDISFFTEGVDMSTLTESLETISRCIDSIISGDEVFERVDMNKEEIVEWLESLTTEQFRKVTNFFVTMPKLRHSFSLKNENTGKDFTIILEGLADFF